MTCKNGLCKRLLNLVGIHGRDEQIINVEFAKVSPEFPIGTFHSDTSPDLAGKLNIFKSQGQVVAVLDLRKGS